jgi:hypothetical protein
LEQLDLRREFGVREGELPLIRHRRARSLLSPYIQEASGTPGMPRR